MPPATSRRPPIPHWDSPAGTCRWCGQGVFKDDGSPNLRRRWHDPCVTAYRIAAFSGDMRKAVKARDGGFCAQCGLHYQHCPPVPRPIEDWPPHARAGETVSVVPGRRAWCAVMIADASATPITYTRGWDADHIVPLEEAARSDLPWPEILHFWAPSNLQTLCLRCHGIKTRGEARWRASQRKRVKDSSGRK